MDQTIKILGIGALIWLILKDVGANVSKNLSAGKIRLINPSINVQGLSFQLLVEIRNNNSVSLPIEAFYGNIRYGNDVLTTIHLPQPEIISASSIVEIPFSLNISFAQLSSNIISLIQSGQYLNSLSFTGTIISNGLTIPVYKQIFSV